MDNGKRYKKDSEMQTALYKAYCTRQMADKGN